MSRRWPIASRRGLVAMLLAVAGIVVSIAIVESDHGQVHSSRPTLGALNDRLALERAQLPVETLEELRTEVVLEARTAASSDAVLNAVASGIAGHAIEVGCAADESDWQWHRFFVGNAAGYAVTVTVTARHGVIAWLAPHPCRGALAVAQGDERYPAARRALGVLVLTHEALHLRRNWRVALDEAEVECAAIRRFKQSVLELGGTPEEAEELWSWALAIHWWLARQNDDYWKKSCRLPFAPI